ncbi:hypothetical protein KAU88_09325 [Candidatus Bathyarchaeota archaeon]|nr:hypothetical protein [Candidatus Bathyarchaeota archaeon]
MCKILWAHWFSAVSLEASAICYRYLTYHSERRISTSPLSLTHLVQVNSDRHNTAERIEPTILPWKAMMIADP